MRRRRSEKHRKHHAGYVSAGVHVRCHRGPVVQWKVPILQRPSQKHKSDMQVCSTIGFLERFVG